MRCGQVFKPDAAFCALCGRKRLVTAKPDPVSGLGITLGFYLAMLAVSAGAMIYVRVSGRELAGFVGASCAAAALTLGFAIARRRLVTPAIVTAGWSWRGYALVLLVAPLVLAVVLGYVHGLSRVFEIQIPRDPTVDGPIALAIVLIVILPPLEEELAFRGVIYGSLRDQLGLTEAFLISSFAFAMLHLSIPSLVTHFPMGLYFCWLRHRSGSIWPGVFAHALHNAGVVIAERI